MTAHANVAAGAIGLSQAVEFAWLEADLLDARDYEPWLALWRPDGVYVIPTDRDATDFADRLNYAYDDHAMREARVRRLRSGFAMSATGAARTVRTLSRFRLLASTADRCELRCAQHCAEYKFGALRLLAADVTYNLLVTAEGLRLERKIIRLINADDALHGLGYLL